MTGPCAARDAQTASLFVVSLPRSLSSAVYGASVRALGLREPAWSSDGEILNLDRHVLAGRLREDDSAKFTRPGCRGFAPIRSFLADVVRPHGMAYKDVVQPFAVADWLRTGMACNPETRLRVLVIEPDVAHVACRMIERGWHYPAAAAPHSAPASERLLHGLLAASRAIASLPGERVRYLDLVEDEGHLHRALQRLYPDRDVARPAYMDPDFEHRRRRLAELRAESGYVRARALVDRAGSAAESRTT